MNRPMANESSYDIATVRSYPIQFSRTTLFCIGLLIATLWLATRPYAGVVEDSRFYTVQALNALLPNNYKGDLYFQYGSQDEFTIFSSIYKPFISAFGIGAGNLVLTVISQFFWLIALIYFIKSLFRDKYVSIVATIMVIVLPGGPIVRYGEPYVTPRIFAEAMTMLALGSMLRGRSIRAVLILCVSLAVHPLMTLPGMAVFFLHEVLKNRIWWLVMSIAVSVALLLAFCGIEPFVKFTMTFDQKWFSIVSIRDGFCSVINWGAGDWSCVCSMFSLGVLGQQFADTGKEKKFISIVLLVTLGSLLVSIFGGDVLKNVLIFDAQTWRATWILAVVSYVYTAISLLRIERRGVGSFTNSRFLLISALILLALSTFIIQFCLQAAAMLVLACGVGIWEKRTGNAIPALLSIVVFILVGIVFGTAIIFFQLYIKKTLITPDNLWHSLVGIALCALAIVVLFMNLLKIRSVSGCRHCSVGTLLLSIILFVIACNNWDQRSPWVKFVDDTNNPPKSLVDLLPASGPIYWEGDVTVPWFLLKRASYFSCDQGTGVLFNRGTAINYQKRFKSFQPLDTLDFLQSNICPAANDRTHLQVTKTELSSVCRDNDGLGALVLVRPVKGDPGKIWRSPVKFEEVVSTGQKAINFETNQFYVYRCDEFSRTPSS